MIEIPDVSNLEGGALLRLLCEVGIAKSISKEGVTYSDENDRVLTDAADIFVRLVQGKPVRYTKRDRCSVVKLDLKLDHLYDALLRSLSGMEASIRAGTAPPGGAELYQRAMAAMLSLEAVGPANVVTVDV